MKQETQDKLLKHAAELADDSLMSSPLLQSAIFGGLGYLGTNYVYNKIANNPWQDRYINSIQDPTQREALRMQLAAERKRKNNMWSTGVGLSAALLPLLNNGGTISDGWKKGRNLWGGPTAIDRTIGGVSGSIVAAINGHRGVSGMDSEIKLRNRNREDLINNGIIGGNDSKTEPSGMDKNESELSYIYDNPINKEASAANDAFFGMDFKMPYVRPLHTHGFKDIPVASSIGMIQSPQNADIMGQELTGAISNGLNQASNGLGAGMISTKGLIQGLTRAGFGLYAGRRLGGILGTIFAQPPEVKEQLKMGGGIAGAILNSGALGSL